MPAMFAKLIGGAIGALVLAAGAAQASEALTVAGRAGFLIGHAQRCGIAEARLETSAKRMDAVIAAFASDDEDRKAAQAEFAESIAIAALAQLLGDKLPSCAVVRSMLTQFEHHQQLAEHREGQMARSDRHDSGTARRTAGGGTMSAKSAKRTSTKPEELSAERRAELQLRRAAQETRGKSASI